MNGLRLACTLDRVCGYLASATTNPSPMTLVQGHYYRIMSSGGFGIGDGYYIYTNGTLAFFGTEVSDSLLVWMNASEANFTHPAHLLSFPVDDKTNLRFVEYTQAAENASNIELIKTRIDVAVDKQNKLALEKATKEREYRKAREAESMYDRHR